MIITLTTDFGLSDPFVGIMKGVIFSIAPDVQVVDLTHDIPSYDILEAAAVVESAFRYFPAQTIHIVVVDPGVGSTRRPIAAAAGDHRFVAPDNGVLSSVLDGPATAFHITNDQLFLRPVSKTFHGRDIFAPVAAHLASGTPMDWLGPRITDAVRRPAPVPRVDGSRVLGVVLRVDKYGNIITNLRRQHLGTGFAVAAGGTSITRFCGSFSEAAPGEFFLIEGSTGYVEIALNQGSAADRLGIGRGAEIEVETRV
jgi:S-adenosyl-L-methionine hydrolase (adenosine-forming)